MHFKLYQHISKQANILNIKAIKYNFIFSSVSPLYVLCSMILLTHDTLTHRQNKTIWYVYNVTFGRCFNANHTIYLYFRFFFKSTFDYVRKKHFNRRIVKYAKKERMVKLPNRYSDKKKISLITIIMEQQGEIHWIFYTHTHTHTTIRYRIKKWKNNKGIQWEARFGCSESGNLY